MHVEACCRLSMHTRCGLVAVWFFPGNHSYRFPAHGLTHAPDDPVKHHPPWQGIVASNARTMQGQLNKTRRLGHFELSTKQIMQPRLCAATKQYTTCRHITGTHRSKQVTPTDATSSALTRLLQVAEKQVTLVAPEAQLG